MPNQIKARDAKPGQRLSLDHDGKGRIVAKVVKSFRTVHIYWTDGAKSEYALAMPLYVIEDEGDVA